MVTIYSDLLDERLERSAHGHANGHGRVDFFTTRSFGPYILGRAVRASGFAHGGWQVSWGRTHFLRMAPTHGSPDTPVHDFAAIHTPTQNQLTRLVHALFPTCKTKMNKVRSSFRDQ
jgi:hypothetical protein